MKAIIHIGLPKTGSSSIQEFLSINRGPLLERGIRHAPFDPDKGSQYELPVVALDLVDQPVPDSPPRKILGLHGPAERRRYAQAYTEWLDTERAGWTEPCFVASSEHLQPWLRGPKAIRALDDFLGRRFSSVQYVLYLRRQTDLIVSAYSERIRRGETLSFDDHLARRLELIDFFAVVRRWEKAVGPERLDVRLLARDALVGGDLIADFCAALGTTNEGLAQPRRMNSSLSAEETALRRRLNRWLSVRRRDGSRNPWYRRALQLFGKRLPQPGKPLALSDAQRQRIEAEFAESNEALRQARFAERASLF